MKQIIEFSMNVGNQSMALIFILSLFFIYNGVILFTHIKKRKNIPDPQTLRFFKKLLYKINHLLFSSHKKKIIFNIVFFIGLIICSTGITLPEPKILFPTEPSLGITEISDKKPLTIKFDKPIDKKILKYEINPKIDGDWQFSNNLLDFSQTLKFVPKESPKMETRYTVSVNNIKSIFGTKKKNYMFSMQTAPAPKVILVNPKDGSKEILPQQDIIVEADYPHEHLAEFLFESNPPLEFNTEKKSDTRYLLKPKEEYKKSTDYNFKIYRNLISYNYKSQKKTSASEKQEIWNSYFRTIDASGIESYSPTGVGVLTNTPVKIKFKQDMDETSTESAFSINPKIEGNLSWDDNRTLKFTQKSDLAKNTKYEITINKLAKSLNSVSLAEDFKFSFTTIGYVTVSKLSPGNGANGVDPNAKITINFNQAVDHGSAQDKFSIWPSVNGSFSWNENAMVFSHDTLGFSQTYTARVDTGVKTINGLDSIQPFSTSFTTKAQTVVLNVPSYKQGHNYSCYATAARMALAYKGAYVSENTILNTIGYDTTSFSGTWGDPNSIWGDPYSGIVGNVDGKSGGINWGYGAYWGPTAAAMSSWRSTSVKSGWSVQGIAQEIANGNPVIVWWVNGVWPAYEVYWKTHGGKTVRGVNSLHVQVVKGFTGTVDNPTSFMVNDSGYGYPGRTFDVGTFKAKWGWFGNSAVVVY